MPKFFTTSDYTTENLLSFKSLTPKSGKDVKFIFRNVLLKIKLLLNRSRMKFPCPHFITAVI